MDWKLIFLLSAFGLAMGVATVFIIPPSIEPACWVAIFLVCAYILARSRRDRLFLHGLSVSLLNSVWITAAHVMLFEQYMARHTEYAAMMKSMPVAESPKLLMVLFGPIIGCLFGVVLGLFAWIFGKFVKPVQAR